ncbi:MAG: hypothetical protein SFU57_10945 [Gemmatimonadales bacterium]|nr:hypothetical protein [Gemmatimonadales bacterium]
MARLIDLGEQPCWMRVAIAATTRPLVERPGLLVTLTRYLRDMFMPRQAEYRRRGGRFILPIPHPEIVA